MDIGVRELKRRLSEYLDRAARGQLIRVTERGCPKAMLGPVPGGARIEEGVAAKWIRAGDGKAPRAVPRQRARSTVLAVLAEDRD